MSKCIRGLSFVVAVVALLGLSVSSASAVAVTWNVAGGGDWDTTTPNWTGGSTFYTEGDTVTFNNTAGGTINLTANRAPFSTTMSAASGTYTFQGGNITSGTLAMQTGGTLVLNNQFTSTGAISLGLGTTLRSGGSNIINDLVPIGQGVGGSGTWDMQGFDETIRWAGSGAVNTINMGNLTVNHPYLADRSGVGIMSGSGSLTFGTGHDTSIIRDVHTYTGGTFINAGLVALYSGANNFPITGDITVTGPGIYSMDWHNSNGNIRTMDTLLGNGIVRSSNNQLGQNTLRVGNGNGSGTWAGVYQGAGSLVKLGTGTQVFSGVNTYSGTTTISAGTLEINGTHNSTPNVLVDSDYTVQAGGTLAGTGTITLDAGDIVTVQNNGTIEASMLDGLTINGGLTLNDGASLDLVVGGLGPAIDVNGLLDGSGTGGVTLNLTDGGFQRGVDYTLIAWDSATDVQLSDFVLSGSPHPAAFIVISGNSLILSSAAIPEPSTCVLLGLGAFGLMLTRRRK